jgi:hypothetical protein
MGSVALALVAGVLVAAWLGRGVVGGAWLRGLRALFPAWRFFDRVAASPELQVRFAAPGAALGAWLPVIAPVRRGWPIAPAANLALAYHGLVEELAIELEGDAPPDPGDALYELVSALARAGVPAALRGRAGARFQWQLVAHDPAGEVLVRSGVLRA